MYEDTYTSMILNNENNKKAGLSYQWTEVQGHTSFQSKWIKYEQKKY